MKQSQRVKQLYLQLKIASQTYNQLIVFLKKENTTIGLRQLQRDIIDLELFLTPAEYLLKNRGKNNILKLSIHPKINAPFIKDAHIVASGFGTSIFSEALKIPLNFLNQAILKKSLLYIEQLPQDATGFNSELDELQFTILPLRVLTHRNDYYLGCYAINKKEYMIIEINHIKKYTIKPKKTKENYLQLQQNFDLYFNSLFGVSKNIDAVVHEIKLEFSVATGLYIQQFTWHPSQKFKKHQGTLQMTLTCGINRELLGWLLSWMYNVRIIGPPELIDYYKKSLAKITEINSSKTLVYRNIFTKKA